MAEVGRWKPYTQRMHRLLRLPWARRLYARRKTQAERPQAEIKWAMRIRRFALRWVSGARMRRAMARRAGSDRAVGSVVRSGSFAAPAFAGRRTTLVQRPCRLTLDPIRPET